MNAGFVPITKGAHFYTATRIPVQEPRCGAGVWGVYPMYRNDRWLHRNYELAPRKGGEAG